MEISLNPIDQLDPVVIIATMLIFSATFAVLRKVFVLPYLVVMEERESMFESADNRVAQAKALLEEAEVSSERSLSDARAAAEELLRKANDEGEAYRKERLASATTAASTRLEAGRTQIEHARQEELARLRQEAVDCVGLACGRLLGETDEEAAASAVDRLMSKRVQ